MDLVLVLQNSISGGVYWCGISGRQLGKLAPNENINLNLNLLGMIPGLQVKRHLLLPMIHLHLQCVVDLTTMSLNLEFRLLSPFSAVLWPTHVSQL